MKLHQTIFPSKSICQATDLYFRLSNNRGDKQLTVPLDLNSNNGITLPLDSKLTTDTYFNAFYYNTYLKYTTVNKLYTRITISGKATIKLCQMYTNKPAIIREIDYNKPKVDDNGKELYSDIQFPAKISTKIIDQQTVLNYQKTTVEFVTDLTQLKSKENGFLYLEITTDNKEAVFYGAEFHTEQQLPLHDVKIGIVICTYRREEFVRNNTKTIRKFLKENEDIRDNIDIFVIDNGKTLVFDDVLGCKLIHNANLGGSGGFARGMMEIHKQGNKYTHFLLMDDDIVFEPEILRKTVGLLRTEKTVGKLSVGASMMKLNDPYFQQEAGVRWTGKRMIFNKHAISLRNVEGLLANQSPMKITYQAWWFMCEHVSKIKNYGFPMPYFIKWDDKEYGYRTLTDVAVECGIGVFHEAFENKYSPHLEYYEVRNALYTYTATINKSRFYKFNYILKHIAYRLVQQRYHEVDLIFKAVDDYYKGAKWLKFINGENLNTELIKSNYQQYTKQELTDMGYNVDNMYPYHKVSKFKSAMTLNGYTLSNRKQPYRVVAVNNISMGQYYRAKTVVNYNPVTEKGFVTTRSRKKLFGTLFRLFGLFFKMLFTDGKIKRSFKKYRKELQSFENWEKLLGIESRTPVALQIHKNFNNLKH